MKTTLLLVVISALMLGSIRADDCDSTHLDLADDKCEFVKKECNANGNFDFFRLYYCTFDSKFGENGKKWAFIPFVLIVGAILLYCLATTADEYLSPTLEYMTIKFGLSESIAGVTFLALGNGSPDVFTSISAI